MKNTINEQLSYYKSTKRGDAVMTNKLATWMLENCENPEHEKNIKTIFNAIGENVFDIINDMHDEEPIDYSSDESIATFIKEFADAYYTDNYDPDYKPEEYHMQELIKQMIGNICPNCCETTLIKTLISCGFTRNDLRWAGFEAEKIDEII